MREKNIKIIIIVLIVIIALLSILGILLYFFTDMFKTNETLFKKYFAQSVKNISEVVDFSEEMDLSNTLQNSDYTENTDMYLNYIENENDEEEIYNIKEQGILNNVEQEKYKKYEISYADQKISTIEILNKNDSYGLRLSNLVKQFVTVENKNLSYLLSSLGYEGQNISEKLNKVDINDLLKFSEEEKEILSDTYYNLIFEDIDGSFYSSQKKALITLNNGQSIETNAYILTLNRNELDKVFKRILNKAISDEIILNKIDNIDAKIKEVGLNEKDTFSLREMYISTLQSIYDDLQYEGEDLRNTVFAVYEYEGITVRTSIKTEMNEYIIDLDNTTGKTLSLKSIELTDEGTDEKVFSIGKNVNDVGFTRILAYSDNTQKIEFSFNSEKQEADYMLNTNIAYTNEEMANFNIESNKNIKISNQNTLPIDFNEENNIVLNNYEGDKILLILKDLKNRFIRSLEKSQASINTKLINNLLVWIDNKEEEKEYEEQNNLELQKQRFNNQFVLYAGENLEYEHIQKLIKVIAQNMEDYQVISGSKIKVLIKKGNSNEEKANEIATAISEDYTYNVDINYSQDGIVDSIDISVYINNN